MVSYIYIINKVKVWVKIILFFHLLAFSPLSMEAKQFTLVIDAGHGGFEILVPSVRVR